MDGSLWKSRGARGAAWLAGLALLAGCSFPSAAAEPTATFGALAPTETSAALPTATEAAPMESTPTQAALAETPMPVDLVLLSASGGNLTVRRGPAPAYNPVSYMTDGQHATATGRNEDGDWLFVDRLDGEGRDGWVYLSSFANISGDATNLPVMPAEPAAAAYLRNCTFHPMLIQPGGFILAEMFDAPNNAHQVNPGAYQAYDQNVEGDPQVFSGEIREGQTIDINTDGLSNTYGC